MDFGTVHLTVLTVTACAVLYADHMGYAYVRGKRLTIDPVITKRLHGIVWVGLILMIASGTVLALPMWEYLLSLPIFYVKIGFVLVLIMNALAIGKLSSLTAHQPFATLPSEIKKTLLVSGALSLIGWVGAAVIGFFFL